MDGRSAIVTGAASGIGRATAHRLAAEGCAVLVTDIEDQAGAEVVAEIAASGGRAGYQRLDVTDATQWSVAVERALSSFGHLDVLVNNAGIGDPDGIEDTSLELYERIVATTQTSVFLGMKAVSGPLLAGDRSAIVNVSSICGASGTRGVSPAYHAAKGAVRSLTKNVALAWATSGVRVNSVHPGYIETPPFEPARGTPIEATILASTPMRRLGQPAEVAAAIAFLCSDEASFITGAELYVDGGFMAH